MNKRLILFVILIAIFVVFIIQNSASVDIRFLVFDITMPRAVLLMLTLGIGMLIGIFIPYRFKKD